MREHSSDSTGRGRESKDIGHNNQHREGARAACHAQVTEVRGD